MDFYFGRRCIVRKTFIDAIIHSVGALHQEMNCGLSCLFSYYLKKWKKKLVIKWVLSSLLLCKTFFFNKSTRISTTISSGGKSIWSNKEYFFCFKIWGIIPNHPIRHFFKRISSQMNHKFECREPQFLKIDHYGIGNSILKNGCFLVN